MRPRLHRQLDWELGRRYRFLPELSTSEYLTMVSASRWICSNVIRQQNRLSVSFMLARLQKMDGIQTQFPSRSMWGSTTLMARPLRPLPKKTSPLGFIGDTWLEGNIWPLCLRIQRSWGSTMKKRRTKMNKHKLKKRRKAARMKSTAKQNA